MKKIITIFMAAVFSIIAVLPVFAIDNSVLFSDISPDSKYISEVSTLVNEGVLTGKTNGIFAPEDDITRAEFCAVLCRAIGVEDEALSEEMKSAGKFSDVTADHWASGYINTVYKYGAANGFDDGLFYPELSVTNEQVIKMLIAAWGYTKEAEMLGGYPNGYMEIASRYGITDKVLFNYGNESKRWVVSVFVYGILQMPPAYDAAVEIPERYIVPASVTDPVPENNGYIVDPVSVLLRVTNESSKYERTLYEQRVPDNSLLPFSIIDNQFFFADDTYGKSVSLSIPNPNEKAYLLSGKITDDCKYIDLSTLPDGEWEMNCTIIQGAIMDSYYTKIYKINGDWYLSSVIRYTVLHMSLNSTEDRISIELSNSQGCEDIPFEIKMTRNHELIITCKAVLHEDEMWSCDVSYAVGQGAETPFWQHMYGKERVPEPFVINDLQEGVSYHLQLFINGKVIDSRGIKGTLEVSDGDFTFSGDYIVHTFHGFEIMPYDR